MEKMLSAPELAEQLDVPEETLQYWRVRGTGPKYSKLGRHVRYDPVDVADWIRARTIKTA